MAKKKQEFYFFKKILPIPIYGGYFIIVFSNDSEKIASTVNCCAYALDDLYAYTFHNFEYKGKEAYSVVFNFWNPTGTITIGTITHEVSHVANRILDARGLKPDWENDEAEAYLKGFLADCIQDFMVKCGLT